MYIEASTSSFPTSPRASSRVGSPAAPESWVHVGGKPTRRVQNATLDLQIGQMLCARLCHDLIGPAAAINAGEELIREGSGDAAEGDEAHELIAESARQLAGRLTFFRIAFGQGSAGGAGLTCAEARALAEGFLAGGRIRLDWQPDPGDLFGDGILSADGIRVLLCLIMLAADALPRGGRLSVRVAAEGTHSRLTLTAEGAAARLAPEIIEALQADDITAVTPRTVHAFYLSCLTARLRVAVELDVVRSGCIGLGASVPAYFVERRRA